MSPQNKEVSGLERLRSATEYVEEGAGKVEMWVQWRRTAIGRASMEPIRPHFYSYSNIYDKKEPFACLLSC